MKNISFKSPRLNMKYGVYERDDLLTSEGENSFIFSQLVLSQI